MSQIVEVQLEDGGRFLVETDAPESDRGGFGSARPDRDREKVSLEIPEAKFKQAVEVLTRAASELFDGIRAIPTPPSSCEVSFGIKMTAGLDAILAKSTGEANFSVKLTWSRPVEAKA